MMASIRRRPRDRARRPDPGSQKRARAPAAPARREGRADAQYGVADRVGAAHPLAQHAAQARRCTRRHPRGHLRRPAIGPRARLEEQGLSRGVLRRQQRAVGRAGRGIVPGQDPRCRLDARREVPWSGDGQGRHQGRPDEALLRAQGSRGAELQRRAPRPGRRRLGVARRQLSARLGKPRHRQGPGPVGDTRVRTETMDTSPVEFRTQPKLYKHWRLAFDGPIATLTMDVQEDGGLRPGYELKLNSYDLGVDIELYDAVQRLRFEHPEVGAVLLTSGKERVFCAGANIRMLGQSSHGFKVNFCKFTNETRNAMEEASAESRQVWLTAVNGACAGGGYELALATEWIVMADDGNTAVSLPEVPLLAVLPGTGGLTRLVDKRKVRRDRADFFCTTEEGVKGKRAVEWSLVDEVVPRSRLAETVTQRARELAAKTDRPRDARGVTLRLLRRTIADDHQQQNGLVGYDHVTARVDRRRGLAEITILGPVAAPPANPAAAVAQGDEFWPLAIARELDDLILHLRSNEEAIGVWVLKTEGVADTMEAYDRLLLGHPGDWFLREVRLYLKRVFKRLEVSSRSVFALIEPGSCFAGTLLELPLAADRSYMLDGTRPGEPTPPATVRLTAANFGAYPMINGLSRLAARFLKEPGRVDDLKGSVVGDLDAGTAAEAGLVTFTPDDIDWEDEVRQALEARAAFSPDALTGMEASLRFGGPETLETKIFGRLSAWQNWIFQRPNAVGPKGALQVYGTGERSDFDRRRV